MDLPSIDEMVVISKKRKRDREALHSSFLNLSSIDLQDMNEDSLLKFPMEAIECCLVAKYGLALVLQARQLLESLPNSLTENQLQQSITEITSTNAKLQDVCLLVLDKFKYLLVSEDCPASPPTAVLSPPNQLML